MNALSRRDFIRVMGTAAAALALPDRAVAQGPDRKPNIIVILADDLGYGDLGCYGGKAIRTPHLDALASGGLRFSDFHANAPICSPTRAALLTGRYQQRMGIDRIVSHEAISPKGLPSGEITFARLLKGAGYATGLMGKWHLGFGPAYSPLAHGFDEFRGFLGGQIDYRSHVEPDGQSDWWNGNKLAPEEGYSTDLITDHAIDFIGRHRDKPFCLYVAHQAAHAPYQGPGDKAFTGPGKGSNLEFGPRTDRSVAYKEIVESLDANVGRLIAALKELRLDGNTLVWFMSDNGQGECGSGGPYRGRKGMLLEGGIRVPGIACWPGKIRPGVVGQTTMTMDVLPTLAALAGAPLPKGVTIDGADLSGMLLAGTPLAPRTLFWLHRGGQWALRQGPWKIWNLRQPWLFNLDQDPGEQHNLAPQQSQRVKQLVADFQAWHKAIAGSGK